MTPTTSSDSSSRIVSEFFNPFSSWQCPHCLGSYLPTPTPSIHAAARQITADDDHDKNETKMKMIFLRGTCRHDICVSCIFEAASSSSVSSRHNVISVATWNMKTHSRRCTRSSSGSSAVNHRPLTEDGSSTMVVEVRCPINARDCRGGGDGGDGVCGGTFLVDTSMLNVVCSGAAMGRGQWICDDVGILDHEVIDLCRDDDDYDVGVKKEEEEEEERASSSSSPPPNAASGEKTSDDRPLKPIFNVGDEVYAAWWDPKMIDDAKKNGSNATWYPGRVKSRRIRRRPNINGNNSDSSGIYGPTQLYHITYNDGDELDDLEDYWVCSKSDYELSRKFDDMGWRPIGVTERYDPESTDEWARMVGWYVVNVNGIERSYTHLEDAMVAHDMCVIREHGKHTKRSYLNLPERHPSLFADDVNGSRGSKETTETKEGDVPRLTESLAGAVVSPETEPRNVKRESGKKPNKPEKSNGTKEVTEWDPTRVAGSFAGDIANIVVPIKSELINVKCEIENTSIMTNDVSITSTKPPTSIKKEPTVKREAISTSVPNVVSPMSGQSLNNEQFTASNLDCAADDQSDVESRFSEVDESDESEEDKEEWREVKRRRLDFSSEENALNAALWTVNREDIRFTKDAFLNKSLFHLNSFVNGKLKRNSAFYLFLREGIATPGFYQLPTTIEVDRIASLTHSQLKTALEKSYGTLGGRDTHGAGQTTMWLKDATVGSFVMMRHEYPKCKFCPRRLMNERGEYIGPLYVIGIITKKVMPWSAEERDIADNKTEEFSKHHWDLHNICRVKWKRMGYKKSLKDSTQSYINAVCQPTLARICHDFTKASHQDIRRDLWMNATIRIRSDDFPDKFEHTSPTTDYPADHGDEGLTKLSAIARKKIHQDLWSNGTARI